MALILSMNYLLKDRGVARATSFAVLWVLLPAASQQPSVGRSDSPYHATDMSKPQESSGDSTTKGRLAAVPVAHKSSLAGLLKISILPS